MAGSTFAPGEQKTRPGIYFRHTNAGSVPIAGREQGVVAAVLQSNWGPLGGHREVETEEQLNQLFGTQANTNLVRQAFKGGALRAVVIRTGGTAVKATLTLEDTTEGNPVNAIRIDAKHPGTRGNGFSVTVRDSLADPSNFRELLVYEGTTLRQTIQFAKGSGEPAALVAAVTAVASPWIDAVKLADGNGLLAAVTQEPLASGTNPSVSAGDYATALNAIEAVEWNVLATDSESPSVHTAIATYIDRVRTDGKRVMAVVAEPTSVGFATRRTNAQTLNNPAIVYVGNGFSEPDGTAVNGYPAGGRIAGLIAALPVTASLTHLVISGAASILGALTGNEVVQAINSGMVVFTPNARRQVMVEYGVTTFVTPDANRDAGWKKIRRVRTRDTLMDRIALTWDPLIGQVNNTPDGRATLMAAAQGAINRMAAEGALLPGGTIVEDPANPPEGDSAWFLVSVNDVDSAEKVYATFNFQFAPAA
jgi:hypothetical protein